MFMPAKKKALKRTAAGKRAQSSRAVAKRVRASNARSKASRRKANTKALFKFDSRPLPLKRYKAKDSSNIPGVRKKK